MEPRYPSFRGDGAGTLEQHQDNGPLRPTGFRNGMPELVGYAWRARVYPWAQRLVAAAIAEHREPVPEITEEQRLRKRRQNQRAWARKRAAAS